LQVEITCRHGNINGEVSDYITRKSEKLLTFHERLTAIGVTVDLAGDRVKVEMLVDAEHKHNFVASASADSSVISTFDSAFQKMEQQIRRYKEKLQDHRRDPAMNELADQEMTTEPADD
jgi:putative sigma-54 modulation protein